MILFKLIYSRYRKREAMAMEGGAGQEVMPSSCLCPRLYMQMGKETKKRGGAFHAALCSHGCHHFSLWPPLHADGGGGPPLSHTPHLVSSPHTNREDASRLVCASLVCVPPLCTKGEGGLLLGLCGVPGAQASSRGRGPLPIPAQGVVACPFLHHPHLHEGTKGGGGVSHMDPHLCP